MEKAEVQAAKKAEEERKATEKREEAASRRALGAQADKEVKTEDAGAKKEKTSLWPLRRQSERRASAEWHASEQLEGLVHEEERLRHSLAGNISSRRLSRASRRMSGHTSPSRLGGSPEDGWDDAAGDASSDEEFALETVENPAAARARKALAAAKAGRRAALKAEETSQAERDALLHTLLLSKDATRAATSAWQQTWRAGGSRRADMQASCGFTSDCLAIDGGDTLVCIGGDGDKCSVSLYSVSMKHRL